MKKSKKKKLSYLTKKELSNIGVPHTYDQINLDTEVMGPS